MTPKAIEDWLAMAARKDYAGLDRLLADDVVFRSPVVHAPQKGKPITAKYLKSAMLLLGNPSFRYVETWLSERSAVLEFETQLEGLYVNGVDIIHWNDDDKIISFKVMVRPLKAINILHQAMAQALQTEN
jgi:ketosteroid isomerase-like protein